MSLARAYVDRYGKENHTMFVLLDEKLRGTS